MTRLLCPTLPPWHQARPAEHGPPPASGTAPPKACLSPTAADLLLEGIQDPGLQARYLKNVLPLVADVRLER